MSNYQHIARRVFNRPHLVEPNYASILIGALTDRLNVQSLVMPDGSRLGQAEMRQAAASYNGRDRRVFEEVEGIAIIPVEGTLVHRFGHLDPYSGMTGYDGLQMKIEAALADPAIRGILLDIDSPGGEVSGCFDLTDLIYESRSIKPVWSVADEMACSAAFSLASAAERIITPRTAQVGSVGVLTAHVDHSRMLEEEGVEVTLIFAGEHKVDGNPYEPLPDSVRTAIQGDIDELYRLFTATVARNLGISEQKVRDTQARIYAGLSAGSVGFTHEVMPVRDILGAFDEYLRGPRGSSFMQTSEVNRMALFGLGKRRKADAIHEDEKARLEARLEELQEEESSSAEEPENEQESLQTEQPADAADDAVPEPEQHEATETEAAQAEPEQQEVASAERIVALCAQANVPQLALGLIEKGASLDQVKAQLANAGRVRDAFAAAGFPELAAKAVETGMDADFAKTLLVEVTAAASANEVSHHQPQGDAQPRKASFNALDFYRNKR